MKMGRSEELDGLETISNLIKHSFSTYPDKEALKQFDRTAGNWIGLSYAKLEAKVEAWRRAYAFRGLKKGDRIAILMPNCIDHACADLAALFSGLVPVPLHAIDTPGSSAFIASDSLSCALVTNKLKRWEAIRNSGSDLSKIHTVVITEPEAKDEFIDGFSFPAEELIIKARNQTIPDDTPEANDLAGIVYTSGTTGKPKGVLLTHRNIVSNIKDTLDCVSPKIGDVFLSFLPLSHTFERMAGYYLALSTGCTIAYNRSVLLLAEDLKTIKPDVIISVPRVYERIFARLNVGLQKASRLKRWIFNTAVETGWNRFAEKNGIAQEQNLGFWKKIVGSFLLKIVSGALYEQFGGRLRIAISGGAAINHDIAKVFCGLGLPIIQGYGMTEASPIIAGNSLEKNNPESVGRPFNSVEVKLSDEGEILIKGPSITQGYWNRPEDTAAAFTSDGWFKTGDVGRFLPDGNLKIVGRIKEIIVTSTGEKIPPADLEGAIQTDPLFNQTLIVGENRPYLSLVAVVNPDEWENFVKNTKHEDKGGSLLSNPDLKAAALKRAKIAAKGFPHYALPRAIVLTKDPWTIENGLLTPTLKLKRKPLFELFKNEIAKLYSTHG